MSVWLQTGPSRSQTYALALLVPHHPQGGWAVARVPFQNFPSPHLWKMDSFFSIAHQKATWRYLHHLIIVPPLGKRPERNPLNCACDSKPCPSAHVFLRVIYLRHHSYFYPFCWTCWTCWVLDPASAPWWKATRNSKDFHEHHLHGSRIHIHRTPSKHGFT